MNKSTFITAINQATLMQNCYTDKKRMVAMWDVLYKELKGENEEDVLKALARIGKSDKTINYFNIKSLIDEGSKVGSYKGSPPLPPISEEGEQEVRELIAKLYEKFNWK